ncbi:diaminopimelate decarboxylase [Tindallia magadiensis]|uniref:Diaminopimelate decarboxylase n=1 Tax=Tindallia magadiensis TaxID=69895 RepID=A0A1I3GKQ7_9FIRM|nr:diaminopimelate decarboxylase [Tindallia magadiensis]SFI24043.1 diaminopimelate decarboxylase [Tindallia magadiensis]
MGTNYCFAGYDTVELAKTYGTPLYVLSEKMIRDKCRNIQENFLMKYEKSFAAYASKAFLTQAICKIIEEEGLGLDVVSGGELYTAIAAKFPMERVIFHGSNKSREELEMAVKHHVGRIIVDNEHELEILSAIAESMDSHANILFRLSPGIEGDTHKYIQTGQKDSKFGLPLNKKELHRIVKKTMANSRLTLLGFHFHLGSQLFENNIYMVGVQIVTDLIKALKNELGYNTEELNVGGGFGIKYTAEEEQTHEIGFYTDEIMKEVSRQFEKESWSQPRIIIEPGRWIIGEAGITLYTIGAIKEIEGIRKYASVDGGMPDNPRPALYQAKYEGVIANKWQEKTDQVTTIAGKCCESGDILIWDLPTPELESGDILVVKNTGAYNYSMASHYNKTPKAAVVLLSDEGSHVIVERETYQDLIRMERLPDYLVRKDT